MSDSPQPENTASTEPEPLEQHNTPNVQILYETTGATLANQILVNSGMDQIILDFSTGVISDPGSDRHILPIQNRVAMTPANAVKLVQTLSGVIQQINEANRAAMSGSADSKEREGSE